MGKNKKKTKPFYCIEVNLFEGSQFDEDGKVSYYEDYNEAIDAFEIAEREMYRQFETAYDSDDILAYEEKLANGTTICTITTQNLAKETDICEIKRYELEMNLR